MFFVLITILCFSSISAKVYFEEKFDDASWESRWVKSEWKSDMGRWTYTPGEWHADKSTAWGIQTTDDLKHHAISAKIPEPFTNEGKDLVIQFTVKHEKKEFAFCGGGYIKLLGQFDQKKFGGDTEYMIMFGPDLCGYDVSRIHAIFTYKGKNLLKKDEIKLDYNDKDEYTHLYTLVVKPDNTFAVYFDKSEKAKGSLFEGWDFPPKSTDDPNDKKPSDWDDEKEIDDPEDKRPADFDQVQEMIVDPDATKPEEWDDELDGEWEAPMMRNPKWHGGVWKPRRIPNPKYKGEWKPRQLANPDFEPNVYLYKDIATVGFEVWTVNNGTIFDNILVTDDFNHAMKVADENFGKNSGQKEKDAKDAWKKESEKKTETKKEKDEL